MNTYKLNIDFKMSHRKINVLFKNGLYNENKLCISLFYNFFLIDKLLFTD